MLDDSVVRDVMHRATEISWERANVICATVWCLSEEAACEALDPRARMPPELRRGLLRKITHDMRQRGTRQCHLGLVDRLIGVLPSLPANQRQGCAYCLAMLCEELSLQHRLRILHALLFSPYVAVRRRGYKSVRANWDPSYCPLIESAWKGYGDPEAAMIIAERFEVQYLVQEFEALIAGLPRPWQLPRLFLRLAVHDSKALLQLAEIDEISFAYVRAKMGWSLSEAEAIEMLERNITDPRVGLLIWAFGRMRLLGVLHHLVEHANEYERRHMEACLDRIPPSS